MTRPSDIVFNNVRMVLSDAVIDGSLSVRNGLIEAIDTAVVPGGLDGQGDYLLPGLVELHTDNLERHFVPRPKTHWPDALAAIISHDAEMTMAGITTVFDSLCIGAYDGPDSPRRQLFSTMSESIVNARRRNLFRVDHQLHFRCELSDPHLMALLEPILDTEGLALVSLMDHTPGQRQWRDVEALRTLSTRSGRSRGEIDRMIQERIERGSLHVAENKRAVLRWLAGRNLTLASHDDTTAEHVLQAVADGVRISEFPCSLEAARTARRHGIATLGGAPNVVRGGSHSGNVAMLDLAREQLLDGLSSDYVPASLLQGAFALVDQLPMGLPAAVKLVTMAPARMVGLNDRGELSPGLRADVIRVRVIDGTPLVREVYVQGVRVA